jgi:hypothetical protein
MRQINIEDLMKKFEEAAKNGTKMEDINEIFNQELISTILE